MGARTGPDLSKWDVSVYARVRMRGSVSSGANAYSARRVGVGGVLALLIALLIALGPEVSRAEAPQAPVRRVDRMWAVGAPVLDASAKVGVYAWVEDKALQLAAHPGDGRGVFRVRVRGTRPLELEGLGDFEVVGRRGDRDVVLQARTKGRTARGKVACNGDLTVTDATRGRRGARLFVGPLAKRAAKRLVIGRF